MPSPGRSGFARDDRSRSTNRESRGRPVSRDHARDQILTRHGAEDTRITGLGAGVAEQEIAAVRDTPPPKRLVLAELHVALRQPLAVHVDPAVALGERLPR